jgi:hypothetical protein
MTTSPTDIGTCLAGCNCAFCLADAATNGSSLAKPKDGVLHPEFEPDFDEFLPPSEDI